MRRSLSVGGAVPSRARSSRRVRACPTPAADAPTASQPCPRRLLLVHASPRDSFVPKAGLAGRARCRLAISCLLQDAAGAWTSLGRALEHASPVSPSAKRFCGERYPCRGSILQVSPTEDGRAPPAPRKPEPGLPRISPQRLRDAMPLASELPQRRTILVKNLNARVCRYSLVHVTPRVSISCPFLEACERVSTSLPSQ